MTKYNINQINNLKKYNNKKFDHFDCSKKYNFSKISF